MKDTYPGPRTFSEAERLQAQHTLIKDAMGGLLVQPMELSKQGLKILDCGTADGFWLYDLHSQLVHPSTATLVGTDIAEFPPKERSFDPPENFEFHRQDIRDPWPSEWRETFDVVHQRAVIANNGNKRNAVKNVVDLLNLVKPGGCIILVDGVKFPGNITETDRPSVRLFKAIGNFLRDLGLDSTLGAQLPQILHEAIDSSGLDFAEIQNAETFSHLGKNAPSGTEDVGYTWLRGMRNSLGSSWRKLGERSPVPLSQIDDLFLEVMEEAQVTGVDLPWFAAWARRMT